jgi:hypothetical protein
MSTNTRYWVLFNPTESSLRRISVRFISIYRLIPACLPLLSCSQHDFRLTDHINICNNNFWGTKGLRPLTNWDLGFKSHSKHICLPLLCVHVVLRGLGLCDGLIPCPRSPTDSIKFIISELINSELKQAKNPNPSRKNVEKKTNCYYTIIGILLHVDPLLGNDR